MGIITPNSGWWSPLGGGKGHVIGNYIRAGGGPEYDRLANVFRPSLGVEFTGWG